MIKIDTEVGQMESTVLWVHYSFIYWKIEHFSLVFKEFFQTHWTLIKNIKRQYWFEANNFQSDSYFIDPTSNYT